MVGRKTRTRREEKSMAGKGEHPVVDKGGSLGADKEKWLRG